MKEADLTFVPPVSPNWTTKAEVPESGWSEAADQLSQDATLGEQGSGGQVRVVVQVKFFPRSENRIRARLWINRANPKSSPEATILMEAPRSLSVDSLPGIVPGIDREGYVVLDIERLRVIARTEILARDRLPDERHLVYPQ
ncbi:hypothetical protein HOY80DRAFT_1032346 [Tuber brumale]|nr:hypothetical protein HOY80DRAFT_1032346 [Tuber brumale]